LLTSWSTLLVLESGTHVMESAMSLQRKTTCGMGVEFRIPFGFKANSEFHLVAKQLATHAIQTMHLPHDSPRFKVCNGANGQRPSLAPRACHPSYPQSDMCSRALVTSTSHSVRGAVGSSSSEHQMVSSEYVCSTKHHSKNRLPSYGN
jgi:hypothetical protein